MPVHGVRIDRSIQNHRQHLPTFTKEPEIWSRKHRRWEPEKGTVGLKEARGAPRRAHWRRRRGGRRGRRRWWCGKPTKDRSWWTIPRPSSRHLGQQRRSRGHSRNRRSSSPGPSCTPTVRRAMACRRRIGRGGEAGGEWKEEECRQAVATSDLSFSFLSPSAVIAPVTATGVITSSSLFESDFYGRWPAEETFPFPVLGTFSHI